MDMVFGMPVFDWPARLQALGVADRVTIQAGNAFESVPPSRCLSPLACDSRLD
jgi:hypothetical protein